MLTFNFNNKKLKVKRDNLICNWAQNICSVNDEDVDLERYDIEDFKNLIRLMKIIETSDNTKDFRKSVEILSSVLSEDEIKSLLTLIHELKIVPSSDHFLSVNIPEDGSIGNVVGPIMANIEKKRDKFSSRNDYQSGGGVSNMAVIQSLLY